MSWSIGYDKFWSRDIGYGVPAKCDHPKCDVEIDRGLSYICGGEPDGAYGCGLFFCEEHLMYVLGDGVCSPQICEKCADNDGELFAPSPDVPVWNEHKLTCPSWQAWRNENPEWVVKHTTKAA